MCFVLDKIMFFCYHLMLIRGYVGIFLMKNMFRSRFLEVGMTALVIGLIALPFVGFAKDGDKIYVDKDASGTQNGSSAHPYEKISQGLDNAENGDEVIVSSGTYKERVSIPKGVKLSGAGKGKTIIKSSSNHDDAVITMKDDAKLWGVTVENGELGIYVRENAKVEISGSEIKGNRHEGIFIEKGDRSDKEKVSIIDCDIEKNGWSGVYSKKRKVVLMDSDIKYNKKNGVVFESGVRAWIDDNSISENVGSGLVMNLDGADITIASGSAFRKNGREGIEISSFGATGNINVKKSKFIENEHYGVARISRVANIPTSVWSGLALAKDIEYSGNDMGTISPIVRGF